MNALPAAQARRGVVDWHERLADLDTDIALLSQAVNASKGRTSFVLECALEDAIRERAAVRREIEANEEVTL